VEGGSLDGAHVTVYKNGERFSFCPHEDLNLPKSYEEVLARFQRLQGDKAWEVLN
jgi:hypothetical protein